MLAMASCDISDLLSSANERYEQAFSIGQKAIAEWRFHGNFVEGIRIKSLYINALTKS